MATIAERVAKGAALLDEKQPGWDKLVDLDRLDIYHCEDCVVGQVYRCYSEGLDLLGVAFGIESESAYGFESKTHEYGSLTSEWYRLIEARRSA